MTIYVDKAVTPWRGTLWCHLFSSDLDALHPFAARLGLSEPSFQCPPRASWPHYDLTERKRLKALRLGAEPADRWTLVLVSNEAMVEWCRRHRADLLSKALAKQETWIARHQRHLERRRVIGEAPPPISDPDTGTSSEPGLFQYLDNQDTPA